MESSSRQFHIETKVSANIKHNTSIKHIISGQSNAMAKGCIMYICLMIDTAFSYRRPLIVCLFLQESSKVQECILHVIWNAHTSAFLLSGTEVQTCIWPFSIWYKLFKSRPCRRLVLSLMRSSFLQVGLVGDLSCRWCVLLSSFFLLLSTTSDAISQSFFDGFQQNLLTNTNASSHRCDINLTSKLTRGHGVKWRQKLWKIF